jgi:hypothetical protein
MTPIKYTLAKVEGPKLKAELTRAENSDPATRYKKVLAACRHAVERWNVWGAWPDGWARWQRALDDAAFKHNHTERNEWPGGLRKLVESPRLEDIVGQAAVAERLVAGHSVRVRLQLPADAAQKLVSANLEELSKVLGIPVKSIKLVEDTCNRRG